MCLIINVTNKLGKSCLPDWLLESASQNNSDGLGLMYYDAKSKKVITHKSVKDYDSILDLIPNTFYSLHFRYSTHGGNSLNNTHPFEIIKDVMYMMHNGIISGYGGSKYNYLNSANGSSHNGGTMWQYATDLNSESNSDSDTVEFLNTEIIPVLKDNPDLILNKGYQTMLANRITSSNKLVFQYKERTITINSDQFHDFEGDKTVKCSNTYAYKKPKKVTHKDVFTKGLITKLNKCQLQDLKVHELGHIAKKLKTDMIDLMTKNREDVLQDLYEYLAFNSMNNTTNLDPKYYEPWDNTGVMTQEEYNIISGLITEASIDYDVLLKLNYKQRCVLNDLDFNVNTLTTQILASDLLDRALEHNNDEIRSLAENTVYTYTIG